MHWRAKSDKLLVNRKVKGGSLIMNRLISIAMSILVLLVIIYLIRLFLAKM